MQNQTILDTYILLWYFIQPLKLLKKEILLIESCTNGNSALISIYSFWEIAMLNAKKRMALGKPIEIFLNSILKIGIQSCDMSPKIAAESVSLPGNFRGDPVDRIIVATARIYNATLLTHDKKILEWAKQEYAKVNRF